MALIKSDFFLINATFHTEIFTIVLKKIKYENIIVHSNSICAYIINLILAILTPIVTLPITWILIKIENNSSMYRFRIDMVIQGVARGFLVVLFTNYLLSLFETEVSFWWVVATMFFLSYQSLKAWDRTKPDTYEFSVNILPILSYLIGLLFI